MQEPITAFLGIRIISIHQNAISGARVSLLHPVISSSITFNHVETGWLVDAFCLQFPGRRQLTLIQGSPPRSLSPRMPLRAWNSNAGTATPRRHTAAAEVLVKCLFRHEMQWCRCMWKNYTLCSGVRWICACCMCL